MKSNFYFQGIFRQYKQCVIFRVDIQKEMIFKMYNTKKIDIYSGIYQPDPYTKPSEKIMREKPWDNDEQATGDHNFKLQLLGKNQLL